MYNLINERTCLHGSTCAKEGWRRVGEPVVVTEGALGLHVLEDSSSSRQIVRYFESRDDRRSRPRHVGDYKKLLFSSE